MSASSVKICFNPDCKAAKSERPRKGWRLRTGEFAELCDRCGLVFEDGRFCETFHPEAAGWRSCESCRKRIHCGCIVSVHESVLLDAGGVECISCARKNVIMVPNSIRTSPFFLHVPLPNRLKNHSVKERNQIAGPDLVAGQWRQACNLWNSAGALSELHTRMPYEVDAWNGIDKMLSVDHAASSLEKKNFGEPSERMMSGSLKLSASDLFRNLNAGIDRVPIPSILEEGIPDGVRHSCSLTGEDDSTDSGKVVTIESGMNTSFAGIKQENHPSSSVNVSQQISTSKDDPSSTPHIDLAAPSGLPNQTNGQTRVSGTHSQQLTSPPLISKQNHANRHNGVESSGEAPARSGKSRGDARGRNQLLPRYWPKITDQELQQISGDSNSVITPLFEKILSASDAGRIGRLVLPKKCAEAYFPTISQPEGLPLKVQDAKGKEWIFQFRFWPNNNSRMYVLEGVTPCIQSMQLQAGDTVTFSRIDPEGKLVMGFRKASTVPSSDQENQTLKTANGVSRSKEVKAAEPASIWSEVDKSGYIAKEVPKARSCLSGKRKRGTLGLKSKRLHIENVDLIELKLTWEEAQRLLRPPPDHVPNVVAIEDHEFEEYKEAPILGKPTILENNHLGELIQWVQCEYCFKWRKLPADALLPSRWTCSDNSWDPKRSSCSSAQELTAEELEDLLSCDNTVVSKKTMADKQDVDAVEAMDGLDTLANLAILGESEALPPLAQPTTKHPRHRPGCTCIVCIQPPSGKGPKHKQTCTCNVCLTVKRRFQTLMSRRERRQSEKEAETARKKQQYQLTEKPEQENDLPISNTSSDSQNQKVVVNNGYDEDSQKKESTSSPFKGQIDLNIQPEREDELSPKSDSGTMMKLLQDASERYLRQQQLPSSTAETDPTINQIDPAKDGLEERGSNHLDTGMDHSITLSMNNMVA